MKPRLDMDKIAKGLRAKRRGSVYAGSGYFGALQLAADVRARFRVPRGGGRPTDPGWTERRQVPLAPKTLKRLEELSAIIREHAGVSVEPLQLAAPRGPSSGTGGCPTSLSASARKCTRPRGSALVVA
jgi:hypothetical protein